MPDRRPYHWLFIGGTGSGKTFTARTVLREYVKKPDHLVIVNSSQQLREFARHGVILETPDLDRDWTPEELAALIRRHGAVHFEVSPGAKPKRIQAFMDALGHAVMSLGHIDTDRCLVLMVIDECQNYISTTTYSDGMRRCHSEGRKYGVDTMQITPQMFGDGNTLDITARRMISILIVCALDDDTERNRLMGSYPEIPDPGDLMPPNPKTRRPAEYLVRDRFEKRACVVRVRQNRRYAVGLVGGLSPPVAPKSRKPPKGKRRS